MIKPMSVISASRRVDMVGFFPHKLAEILQNRCPPEKVHSIVLWSKDPRHLLTHTVLRETLKKYELTFLHLTVSGMGGSYLESGIPSTAKCLALLPELVEFLGSPRRIRLRFDPVVHLRLPDGKAYSNLSQFENIARTAMKNHVHEISISWMQSYDKVNKRLEKYGIVPLKPGEKAWQDEWEKISGIARSIGIHVHGCCVPGLRISRCIDGELLTILHPRLVQASLKKAGGQRELCGCTESWDIGWYYPCPGRCVYCYARPVELSHLTGRNP